jgi:hypothetical protein
VVAKRPIVAGEVARPGLHRAAGSSIGRIHVPGNRARGRSDGCRRNGFVIATAGSVVMPSGPLSASVIPVHDRVCIRTLIAASRSARDRTCGLDRCEEQPIRCSFGRVLTRALRRFS